MKRRYIQGLALEIDICQPQRRRSALLNSSSSSSSSSSLDRRPFHSCPLKCSCRVHQSIDDVIAFFFQGRQRNTRGKLARNIHFVCLITSCSLVCFLAIVLVWPRSGWRFLGGRLPKIVSHFWAIPLHVLPVIDGEAKLCRCQLKQSFMRRIKFHVFFKATTTCYDHLFQAAAHVLFQILKWQKIPTSIMRSSASIWPDGQNTATKPESSSQEENMLTGAPLLVASAPDGGFVAWLQCASSFALFMATWGIVSSFGIGHLLIGAEAPAHIDRCFSNILRRHLSWSIFIPNLLDRDYSGFPPDCAWNFFWSTLWLRLSAVSRLYGISFGRGRDDDSKCMYPVLAVDPFTGGAGRAWEWLFIRSEYCRSTNIFWKKAVFSPRYRGLWKRSRYAKSLTITEFWVLRVEQGVLFSRLYSMNCSLGSDSDGLYV